MVEKYLEGRSILVFGGVSGIGRKVVAESLRAGVRVYAGALIEEDFNTAIKYWKTREKLDTDNLPVSPFYTDIRDSKQIGQLAKDIKAQGKELTDVIFSQAGGMEGFIQHLRDKHLDPLTPYTLSTPIDELPVEEKKIAEDKVAAMKADLEVWTKEAFSSAVAVNFQGTFEAIDVLKNVFPNEFRTIYLNSTWGDLSGTEGVEIPLLYRAVDRSKGLARDKFEEEGQELAKMGIFTSIVIASLVSDTNVGKMFNDFFLNLMDKEQREAVKNSSVKTNDVWTAIRELLESNPNEWLSYPRKLYVYKKDGQVVLENKLELSAMYTHPYRF